MTRWIDEINVLATQGSLDEGSERLGFGPEDLPRLPGSWKSEYGSGKLLECRSLPCIMRILIFKLNVSRCTCRLINRIPVLM